MAVTSVAAFNVTDHGHPEQTYALATQIGPWTFAMRASAPPGATNDSRVQMYWQDMLLHAIDARSPGADGAPSGASDSTPAGSGGKAG